MAPVLTDLPDVGGRLRSAAAAPLRPQTYRNLIYLSLAFPLGFAYVFLLAVGAPVGAALVVVAVGVPLLAAVVAAGLGLAGLERRLTELLLGVEFPARSLPEGRRRDRLWAVVTDPETWAGLVYLPVRFLFGIASFVVVMNGLVTGVALLVVPLYYDQPGLYVGLVADRPVELHPALYVGWNRLLVGVETVVTVGAWRVDTPAEALVVAAVGAVVCLAGLTMLNWLARLNGWVAKRLLAGAYGPFAAVQRHP